MNGTKREMTRPPPRNSASNNNKEAYLTMKDK
jgi:hypothetical protein